MASAALTAVVRYCDKLLKTPAVIDWKGAANGLQVENSGKVTRIAAAVDATRSTVEMAIGAGADLLLVHHGLFWSPSHPWTGRRYELIRLLLDNNLAVYSSHLPLDCHPRLGNNAQLCDALGLKDRKPFFLEKERYIGFQSVKRISRERLAAQLEAALGIRPTLLPGGPRTCRKIGVVTGGAGGNLDVAAGEGIDTFITGEGPHHTFGMAEELGINVFYGGHYATETFGVKALAQHLAVKYHLSWCFLDHPSGL